MFFTKNAVQVCELTGQNKKDAGRLVLNQEQFKLWLDRYPFVRILVRESLMPRVWTLQSINAVQQHYHHKEFTIENLEEFKTDDTKRNLFSSRLSSARPSMIK